MMVESIFVHSFGHLILMQTYLYKSNTGQNPAALLFTPVQVVNERPPQINEYIAP